MFIKLIIILATAMLSRCKSAAVPLTSLPAVPAVSAIDTAYHDPHPQYSYAYNVQDVLTGDSKNQHESRNGDVVRGSYSFIEADGTRRIVEYTADPINGFNAVVRREPIVTVKPVVAPFAYQH